MLWKMTVMPSIEIFVKHAILCFNAKLEIEYAWLKYELGNTDEQAM